MNQDLQGLKTVIRTSDFNRSKEFYVSFLNLKILEEYDDENGSRGCILGLSTENNNALIEISEIKATHDFYQPAFDRTIDNDKIEIQIRTNSVDYWTDRLNNVWETKGPIDRPWGSRYLYLRDPDGIRIVIYQEK